MFGDYDDGADANCVRCGAPIYFQVGMGSSKCNSCGGNWEKTDEKLEREKFEDIIFQRKIEASEALNDDTITYLYKQYKTSKDNKEKRIIANAMEHVDSFHRLTQRIKGF